MATDPARSAPLWQIECTLDTDPRLVSAVAAIAAHSVLRAGLSEKAQEDFTAAVAEACREAFNVNRDKGSVSAAVKVVSSDFPDRIEATLEFSEPALKVSSDSFDRTDVTGAIQRVVRDGRIYVTLAKSTETKRSSNAASPSPKV